MAALVHAQVYDRSLGQRIASIAFDKPAGRCAVSIIASCLQWTQSLVREAANLTAVAWHPSCNKPRSEAEGRACCSVQAAGKAFLYWESTSTLYIGHHTSIQVRAGLSEILWPMCFACTCSKRMYDDKDQQEDVRLSDWRHHASASTVPDRPDVCMDCSRPCASLLKALPDLQAAAVKVPASGARHRHLRDSLQALQCTGGKRPAEGGAKGRQPRTQTSGSGCLDPAVVPHPGGCWLHGAVWGKGSQPSCVK